MNKIILLLMSLLVIQALTACEKNNIKKTLSPSDQPLTKEELDTSNSMIAEYNNFMKDSTHPINTITLAARYKTKFYELTKDKNSTAVMNARDTIRKIPVYKQFCMAAMLYQENDKVIDCYNIYAYIEDDNKYATTSAKTIYYNLIKYLERMGKFEKATEVQIFFLSKYSLNK